MSLIRFEIPEKFRFEIPEKFRFKKLKNTLLQKRDFVDFAIWKLAESTHDDGKELFSWSASDYFGMQDSIDAASRKSKPILTVEDLFINDKFIFDKNLLPQYSLDGDYLSSSPNYYTIDFANECDATSYNWNSARKTPKFTKNHDFYESIWDALVRDEAFVAELIHIINRQYKAVRRIYFELFHWLSHQVSITFDLSKYYEYFDIVTTLKEGSEFVQTSTNSVKMADTSRKPFIKNGKSFKLKKYTIAA